MLNKFCHNIDGFTLVEFVVTIIILSFTSFIILPFFQSISHSPDALLRQRAVALGQAMMDEIMAKKWDSNSPNGGGPLNTTESSRGSVNASAIGREVGEGPAARLTWDDVDDYNSFTESDTFDDHAGSSFSLNGYTRTVAVTYIPSDSDPITTSTPTGTTIQASRTDSKRIVVSVLSPLNETFEFVAVVCNF